MPDNIKKRLADIRKQAMEEGDYTKVMDNAIAEEVEKNRYSNESVSTGRSNANVRNTLKNEMEEAQTGESTIFKGEVGERFNAQEYSDTFPLLHIVGGDVERINALNQLFADNGVSVVDDAVFAEAMQNEEKRKQIHQLLNDYGVDTGDFTKFSHDFGLATQEEVEAEYERRRTTYEENKKFMEEYESPEMALWREANPFVTELEGEDLLAHIQDSAEFMEKGSPRLLQNIIDGNIGDVEYAWLDNQRNVAIENLEKQKAELQRRWGELAREGKAYKMIQGPERGEMVMLPTEEGAPIEAAIKYADDQIVYYRNMVTIEDWKRNGHKAGFLQGFKNTDLIDIVTLGAMESVAKQELGRIVQKASDGEELTPEEQMALDTINAANNVGSTMGALGGATRGYRAGYSTSQSLPYMAQFAVFGPFAGGVGAGVSRFLLGKGAGKMVAGIGKAVGIGGTMTALNPQTTTTTYYQHMLDEYNQYGEVEDIPASQRLRRAYGTTFAEFLSEASGGILISKLKGVAPDLGFKRWFRTKFNLTNNEAITKFLDNMQWNGTLEEFEEELFNNLVQPIFAGEDVSESWAESFSGDNLAITALSVLGTSVMMGAAPTAIQAGNAAHWRSKANTALKGITNQEFKQSLYDAVRENNPEAVYQRLGAINWGQQDDVDIQRAMEYINYHTYAYMSEGAEMSEASRKNVVAKVALVEGMARKGDVYTGEYEGKPVYVVEANEDSVVVVKMDGSREQVPFDAIRNLEQTPLEDVIRDIYAQEEASVAEATEAMMEDKDKATAEEAGVQYTPIVEETVVVDESQVDAEEQAEQTATPTTFLTEDVVRVGDQEGVIIGIDEHSQTARVQIGEDSVQVPLSEIALVYREGEVEQPTTPTSVAPTEAQTTETTTIQPILNEQGEEDYVAMGEEQTTAYVQQQLGEDALGYAEDQIAEKQKALKKAQSREKLPLNLAERKVAIEQRKAEVQRIEQEIAMWEGVKNRLSQPTTEVAQEVSQHTAEEATEQTAQEEQTAQYRAEDAKDGEGVFDLGLSFPIVYKNSNDNTDGTGVIKDELSARKVARLLSRIWQTSKDFAEFMHRANANGMKFKPRDVQELNKIFNSRKMSAKELEKLFTPTRFRRGGQAQSQTEVVEQTAQQATTAQPTAEVEQTAQPTAQVEVSGDIHTQTQVEATPFQAGVLMNEEAKKYSNIEAIDKIAKDLGVRIAFVDDVWEGGVEGNGLYIKDKDGNPTIYISSNRYKKGAQFVIGHELLHRIKDVNEELYARFASAVLADIGEKRVSQLLNKMRSDYRIAIRLAKLEGGYREMLNNATTLEERRAIERRLNAEVEAQIPTEEVLLEEIVADYMGQVISSANGFTRFAERHMNNKPILRALRDAIAYVRSFFRRGTAWESLLERRMRVIDNLLVEATSGEQTTSGRARNTSKGRHSIREMDEAYMEAVERGDMETAQQMVNEAAERAGYTTDESWKMSHRAPRIDEENANPFNTEKIVPEDYWEHPEWYSILSNTGVRESYRNMKSAIDEYKRLVAEGKQEEADAVTVRMYRGVDSSANQNEASFRNGDWITPSRSYAYISAPEGRERIIEQDVPLRNIWWDGNSINEWGYDDGSNYTYADTENNRKLLDAVTYDNEGNVIPLSQRFDMSNADVRFSIKNMTEEQIEQGVASANSKQKLAGADYGFDPSVRFSLGKRKQEEMYGILNKRRPDLTDEEKLATIAYLDGINNNKQVKVAFHYFVNGSVRFPEDMPKVEQAVEVAEKAKVDPMGYKSPMELIDAHLDIEIKQKPINPDTVPTLRNKVDYGNGITVYDVEESEESRQNMREIINTHYGKESSPWCLLQGDGEGNLTEKSKIYWADYNEFPKRVAFYNGKLLAFYASDDVPTWWDRQDFPHEGGIPVTRKMDDGSGRTATYVFNEETKGFGNPINIHRGNRKNGLYEEWYDETHKLKAANYKDGNREGLTQEWFENGNISRITNYKNSKRDGLNELYYPNGQLNIRRNYKDDKLDGLAQKWNEDGQLIAQIYFKDDVEVPMPEGIDTRFSVREQAELTDATISQNTIADPNSGKAFFSLRTYDEQGRADLKAFLDARVASGDLTSTEAEDIISQMEEIYEVCKNYTDKYAPFGAWSNAMVVEDEEGNPVFSVIKANGEYKMNLDFSLVCKKRRTLDAVLNEMIGRGLVEDLTDDPVFVAQVNDVIRKYGFETACRLCFVDAKRFRVVKVAKQFADIYNKVVRSMVPKGKKIPINSFDYAGRGVEIKENGLETRPDSELKIKALQKMSKGRSVNAKIAKHLLANPQDRKLVAVSDFVSTRGFDAVSAQNRALLGLYNSKKGSGGPKAALSDVQYLGDVAKANWKVEEAYSVGGVRIQSFSDFVPRMVFDYIQMVADLAGKKLPAHAYTKEVLFAQIFGKTGIKINLSLVPAMAENGVSAGLDAEGNYVWQEGETFPFDVAIELQNAEGYKENVGTIAVGVSDAHILKMLDDENIRMVIPYHKSGLNPAVAKANKISGFSDYTKVQNTRYKNGTKLSEADAKNAPNFNELLREKGSAKEAADAYLAWCAENDYKPKFDKFASHPNYYKLLEDFTTTVDGQYAPQEEVRMVFPTENDAFGSLGSLIEQGLEEDAILEGMRTEKVSDIVDEIESNTRFSLRGGDTFYSNAEYAVRNIKQEKATPEQWLKMIEKNGGLKAGEDKWLGLSDWLKESKAKTLTKQEVLDYINSNKIVVEDVAYSEISREDLSPLQEEFDMLIGEGDEVTGSIYTGDHIDWAWQQMLDRYGDDFGIAFDHDWDKLTIENAEAASIFIGGDRAINSTRLEFTTNGLTNKREIALVVPTIEPWKENDDIHFGDAGEGRAVAWVRFGDAEAPVRDANYVRLQEIYDRLAELEIKIGFPEGITMEEYEERARLREERDSIPESGNERILVIDEIQSNRHQEGREKGYRDVEAEKREKAERERELTEVVLPRIAELNSLFNEKYGEGKWWDVEYDAQWRPRRVYRYLTPEEQAEYEALHQRASELQTPMPIRNGIPSAPFDKNWHEVAMKRILRYAAENGYEKVAWTTGDQQAKRYDIGNVIESAKIMDGADGGSPSYRAVVLTPKNDIGDNYVLYVNKDGIIRNTEGAARNMGLRDKHLSDVVGKALAEKLLSSPNNTSISGDGLRIGGEGMKAFYDQMLPNFMNKYGKKWGVKVGEVTMPNLRENNTMHSVDITDDMRESVMQGQPLFSLRQPTAEEQAIIDQAKADGTYLLAPNGNTTNLTPKQWAQVRTTAFKDWFGDWENDPENASKVVDENGEPMVVYHGSNWKGITTFDRSQSKRRRSGLREYGHFFTTNRALAELYSAVDDAPEVVEGLARLDAQIETAAENKDIDKMLDLYTEKERITRNLGGRVYEVFLNMRDVAEFDANYQADRGWYNLKADVGYKTAIGRDAMEAYAGQNSMTGDRLRKDGIIGRNIIDLFVGTENKEALMPYYDKFGGDVFLVFDPQNIKSATENVGTFNSENADYRFSLREMDAPYLDAVERGDWGVVEEMVEEAAQRVGYTEKVYHGTPRFGFTEFVSNRPSGAIFTTSRSVVSANYAGDSNYAGLRRINKGYKTPQTNQDILDNARSVYNLDWRFATQEDKNAIIERVEQEAQMVLDKVNALRVEMPEELETVIAEVESIIFDGVFAREYELSPDTIETDYELSSDARERLREYDTTNLNAEQLEYYRYLLGYEFGDARIDVGMGMPNALRDGVSATVTGKEITPIEKLAEATEELHNIGSYELYGNLGDSPLVIDAEGKAWYALDFNGMRDTDAIVEWAKENGYTSVVFKNIFDYGDKSDVKVFFDSKQVKSADPVTYDDNGNIIPLSERFNPNKEDIRFSLRIEGYQELFNELQKESASLSPNDRQALVDFRAKKRDLVERYWTDFLNALGADVRLMIVDSTENPDVLIPIYEEIVNIGKVIKDNPKEIPTYKEFIEELDKGVVAFYIKGTNIIAADIARADKYNHRKVFTQIILHEHIHQLVDRFIAERTLMQMWREVGKTKMGKKIRKAHDDLVSVDLSNEFLAYTITGFSDTSIKPLLDYIEGQESVSFEDIMKTFGESLPLKDKQIEKILNILRYEYTEKGAGATSQQNAVVPQEVAEAGSNTNIGHRRANEARGDLRNDGEASEQVFYNGYPVEMIDEEFGIVDLEATDVHPPKFSLREISDKELERRLNYVDLPWLTKKWEGLRKTFQDYMVEVGKFQKALERAGVKITDDNNFYASENAASARADVALDRYYEEYITPLQEFFGELAKRYNLSYEDITDYLLAKHSLERHESGLNAINPDDGHAWSRKNVEKIIRNFETNVEQADVDMLWWHINRVNNRNLEILVEGGVKSRADIDLIKSHNWQYYVPLMEWDEEANGLTDPTEQFDVMVQYRNGATKGKWYQPKAEGRTTKPAEPLANMIIMGSRAIISAETNKAKIALYNLLKDAERVLGGRVRGEWHISQRYYVKDSTGQWVEKSASSLDAEEIELAKAQQAEIKKLKRERTSAYIKANELEANGRLKEAQAERQRGDALGDAIKEKEAEVIIHIEKPQDVFPHEIQVGKAFDKQREVVVYINGKLHTIEFRNPRYSSAINNADNVNLRHTNKALNMAFQTYKWMTRAMSQLSTTLNPAFALVTNPIRDFLHASIIHMMDAQNGHFRGFEKQFIGNWGSRVGAIWRGIRREAEPLTKAEMADKNILNRHDRLDLIKYYGEQRVNDTLFKIYQENGGQTGFAFMQDIDAVRRDVRKRVSRAQRGKNIEGDGIRQVLRFYDDLTKVAEVMTRYCTFLAAIDAGQSVGQAVDSARNITVNFGRRGNMTSVMSGLYVFFNAYVQGNAQILKVASTKGNRARSAMMLATLAGLGYLMSLIANNVWGGDDDEDELTQTSVPEWLRRGYFAIPLQQKSGAVIRLPMPQGLRIPFALGAVAYDYSNGNIDGEEAWRSVQEATLSDLAYGYSEGSTLSRTLTPSAMQWRYDLKNNTDAWGRPIYREDTYGVGYPNTELGMRNVNPVIKDFTDWLNEITGGDELKSGKVDINPSKVEYFVESLFGGVGGFARRTGEFASSLNPDNNVEFELQNIPFLGSLLYSVNPDSWYPKYSEFEDEYGKKSKSLMNRRIKEGLEDSDSPKVTEFSRKAELFEVNEKVIQTLIELRNQHLPSEEAYQIINREINRQRGLTVKLMEEVDINRPDSEVVENIKAVIEKYDPNREDNINSMIRRYGK